MVQPATPCGVLLLLLTFTAQAQPETPQPRTLTLPGPAGAPLPEVRVRASITTLVLFDALIDRASVQLDTTRFRLVDVGERSLILEPRVSPGPQERWVLRVRYASGVGPEEWAAFALVSHPDAVDTRIEVVRAQPSLAACQAELAEAQARGEPHRAEAWVLAGRLGGLTAQAVAFPLENGSKGPLSAREGVAYRLATGALLVLAVANSPGQPAWAPTEAVLLSRNKVQEAVKVRTVSVKQGPIAPGAVGWVAVEAELPSPQAGQHFSLELRAASGQGLIVKKVVIPAAQPQKGGGP